MISFFILYLINKNEYCIFISFIIIKLENTKILVSLKFNNLILEL
jgi:hypothetical protein